MTVKGGQGVALNLDSFNGSVELFVTEG